MTNTDLLIKVFGNRGSFKLINYANDKESRYEGESLIGKMNELINLARADERAKVIAEMKEAMNKICPLANTDTTG